MEPEQAADLRAWKIQSEIEKLKYLLVLIAVIGVAGCVLVWMVWDKLPD